jgi:hypothetical protein
MHTVEQGMGGKTVFQGNCFQECFDKNNIVLRKGKGKQTNKLLLIRSEMK